IERELARAGAAFVDGRQAAAPIAGGLLAVGGCHLHLHELFGLREGGGGNRRAGLGRSAESRRGPGGRGGGLVGSFPATLGSGGDQRGRGAAQKLPARV